MDDERISVAHEDDDFEQSRLSVEPEPDLLGKVASVLIQRPNQQWSICCLELVCDENTSGGRPALHASRVHEAVAARIPEQLPSPTCAMRWNGAELGRSSRRS